MLKEKIFRLTLLWSTEIKLLIQSSQKYEHLCIVFASFCMKFTAQSKPIELPVEVMKFIKKMQSELPNTYFLSPEQRQFYEDNGYLVIKGFLDFASLYNCKQRFLQVCKGQLDRGAMTIVNENNLRDKGLVGEHLINKVQDIHYDDVFMTYTEHPRLLHVLSQFIGDDIDVMHSMFINKPPGSVRHPPHQDLCFFPFRPAEKIIASWTAIDDVTIDNGCLYVVPKSHKRNILYAHGNLPGSNKLYHGILDQEVSNEPRVQLEMSPGDTVFFHPLLVHGSGANNTKGFRKSISAHYASATVKFMNVRGSIQDQIARDFEKEGKRRGLDVTFADTWKFKSKPVKRLSSKL